ncbi:hypothetical protein EPN18_08720 [bacterium]|nr:MAG: hypothetical protein EPN18_08720 [bacterium]
MKNWHGAILAITLFLFAVGCTHTHRLEGFNADPAKIKGAEDKKVAVIFIEPQFQNHFEESSNGHTFIFEENKAFYEQAYSSALKGKVASVEYFTSEPQGSFDFYLYPSLKLS